MLKGLSSDLLCHIHWVPKPHTFCGESLQPFSHSVFLCPKFNWLAWSGICWWLPLTFRSVNGTEAVLQLCYLSGKATLTLKVIQLKDIIPRCLATCVLPCHVAGCTTVICFTLSRSYMSGVWPSWDRRQQWGLYPATQVPVQMVLSILQRRSPWQKQTSTNRRYRVPRKGRETEL